VVFLTYRASPAVDAIARRVTATRPLYDFTASDEVAHTMWRVTGDDLDALVKAFAALPALYIADGHHRAASASRAHAALPQSREAGTFVATAFPDRDVRILSYNRVVKDLGSQTPAQFLSALGAMVKAGDGTSTPAKRGDVGMYLDRSWRTLTLPGVPAGTPRADALDVERLQQLVLEPHLGIGDPRTDKRIDFVGGVRGLAELERRVVSGRDAAAFAMRPTRMEQLMAVADADRLMPPKSTWFEPKLADGLLSHVLD